MILNSFLLNQIKIKNVKKLKLFKTLNINTFKITL